MKTAFVPFTGTKQSMRNMYILVQFVKWAYRIKSEKTIFWLISVVWHIPERKKRCAKFTYNFETVNDVSREPLDPPQEPVK